MNKIKNIIIYIIILMFVSGNFLIADESTVNSGASNINYKVMFITLIIWIALSIYIYHLHKKVKNLEKKINEK